MANIMAMLWSSYRKPGEFPLSWRGKGKGYGVKPATGDIPLHPLLSPAEERGKGVTVAEIS
jgi:hypothetical protein